MRAICLNCTLNRSPEPSSTESLARVVLDALAEHGVESDTIRLADHRIDPGVVSEAVAEGRGGVADDRRASTTGRTAAANLAAVARALESSGMPAPAA